MNCHETHYPTIEKEATVVIEPVRKWSHFLFGQHFTVVTDQKSVEGPKLRMTRSMANFSYDICYCPGCYNIVTDVLSHAYCNANCAPPLKKQHDDLCHPGITGLLHYAHSENMHFSTEEVKKAWSPCKICAKLKQWFTSLPKVNLIKATQPLE